ncbi:MAG: class I SAM-dependent methyltransferase [Dehalococcoidia bacterium]|nr:class I SAM-dependent methyltransferase [Dehalococcoidia bacterium]
MKSYREEGLGKRAQILVDELVAAGIGSKSVLEIGAGIGALNLELVKGGASHSISIDASSANVTTAVELAEELGLDDRSDRCFGDFVEVQDQIESADIVLLDRVICCYPNLSALVGAAGEKTKLYCGLTYPRRTWWGRASFWMLNVFQALRRHPFRVYMHSPTDIELVLKGKGLTRIFTGHAGFWEVAIFETVSR